MNDTRSPRSGALLACLALLLLGAGRPAARADVLSFYSLAALDAIDRAEAEAKRGHNAQALVILKAAPEEGGGDRRALTLAAAKIQREWGASLMDERPALALPHFQAAFALDRVLRPDNGSVSDLDEMANCYEGMGRHARARVAYRQALARLDRREGPEGAAPIIAGLGASYVASKRPAEALPLLRQALPVFQKAGDAVSVSGALSNIGGAYDELHQPAKALPFYQQAQALFQQTGDKLSEAYALGNIGECYAALHQPATALGFYRRALPLLQEAKGTPHLAQLRADIRAAQRAMKGP